MTLASGSLPIRYFVVISHADAALTKVSLPVALSMADLARRESCESPNTHHRKAWVSRSSLMLGYSQRFNSSSGRGSKNSGPTEPLPRGGRSDASTIFSPASARATSLDKFVLAE